MPFQVITARMRRSNFRSRGQSLPDAVRNAIDEVLPERVTWYSVAADEIHRWWDIHFRLKAARHQP